jgi:hypothetical protein
MRPWSVGGSYDRPIARRIIEQAGVPRKEFGERKRVVTPVYDSITRRTPPIGGFLSDHSLAEFERWFAAAPPIRRARALRHNLLAATIGRAIWSARVTRALRRLRLRWPPFAARLWHLRVPVRRNAFVFNWAVERQAAWYRRAVARAGPDGKPKQPQG